MKISVFRSPLECNDDGELFTIWIKFTNSSVDPLAQVIELLLLLSSVSRSH